MKFRFILFSLFLSCAGLWAAGTADYSSFIRTPPAPPTPHVNGPDVFGVRPDTPFLYTIPATGDRPMTFNVKNLPAGLSVNSQNGQITGQLEKEGEYDVVLQAKNALGEAKKKFRIICGNKIALTPPMGWNDWNCWGASVDQKKVLAAAKAMVSSGLINHGWTYINIDDSWQGQRTGKNHALQPNSKFPDMKALCDEIHRLGLKVGIYSTPFITSYAGYPGETSDNPDGTWSKAMIHDKKFGKYSFVQADVQQWAAWGIDYLKYDWNPIDPAHVKAMSMALRNSGRDIVFSLSNHANFHTAAELARWANSWRTTGDIFDSWDTPDQKPWDYTVSGIAFSQDRWAPYAGPGHWNDPDMLVVGYVGWGPQLHLTHLTPNEQYTQITAWCMLSAPLLLGCDLNRLDPFTLNLLENDQVLAIDQDALGKQATRVATLGAVDVYLKDLEHGAKAVAFFNRSSVPVSIIFNKLYSIGVRGRWHVRDLWRQKNLPEIRDASKYRFKVNIAAHSAELYEFTRKDAR